MLCRIFRGYPFSYAAKHIIDANETIVNEFGLLVRFTASGAVYYYGIIFDSVNPSILSQVRAEYPNSAKQTSQSKFALASDAVITTFGMCSIMFICCTEIFW